jgi:hypothetical protein
MTRKRTTEKKRGMKKIEGEKTHPGGVQLLGPWPAPP